MAEWSNGGMARMAEWHMEWGNDGWNGRMVEWQNGRMAEWHNGRMAGMADRIYIDDLIVVLRL